jgi:hypothetical protein
VDAKNGWPAESRPDLHQLPSPFLAEMDLDLARRVSVQIDAGERQFELAHSVNSSVVQRYLDEIAPNWTAEDTTARTAPILGDYLKHEVYGTGRVTDIDEQGVLLNFTGQLRFFPHLLIPRVFQAKPQTAEHTAVAITAESDFRVGDILSHEKFGRGAVLAVDEHTIAVKFSAGQKTFRTDLFQARKFV